MKRITLGPKTNILATFIILFITIIIFAIETIIARIRIINIIIDILGYMAFFGLLFLIPAFLIQDVSGYAELKENKIILKMPFRTIGEYDKQAVVIHYATKIRCRRGGTILNPCLAIGTLPPNTICFERHQLCKYVDDNYFLVQLDNEDKLNLLLAYFNQKVKLPEKEEWEDFKKQWKKTHRPYSKSIQRFYDLIELYNQTKDN